MDELEEEEEYSKAFKDLKHDYKQAKQAKSEIDQLISGWNDAYYGLGLPKVTKNGSSLVRREVAKQIEWMKANMTEPFTSTNHPVRVNSIKGQNQARIMQKYANNEFVNNFDRETFMSQLVDVLLREGTAWTRTGWDFREKVIEENITSITMPELLERQQKGQEPFTITKNEQKDGQPETFNVRYKRFTDLCNKATAEVCRNEHILPDPSARDDNDLRFLFHERLETISSLKESGLYDKDDLDKLESSLDDEREESTLGSARNSEAQAYGYKQDYKTKDKARRKIKIVEYWGFYDLDGDGIAEPIVATWAEKEDVNLRIEENPMPSKAIPFQRAVYSARPFSLWGNALAYFIEDNQKAVTGISRGILDNMSGANNGQKFIKRGGLDYINFKRMRDGERHIMTNKDPREIIQDGGYNVLPASVFNTMEMFVNESRELSGMSGGMSLNKNSLNKDDNGDMQLTMAQQKMAGAVRNIGNLISKIVFEWINMAGDFLNPEQIEDLFQNSEKTDYYLFREAKTSKVSCKVGTEVTRSMRLKQINLLMQQSKILGEKAPPGTIEALTAEMFELFDKYDEAEAIRTYVPQPSPEQQMMQQLAILKEQLEVEKLKIEIANLQTESQLNQTKSVSQMAIAKTTLAHKESQINQNNAETQKLNVETALLPATTEADIRQKYEKKGN